MRQINNAEARAYANEMVWKNHGRSVEKQYNNNAKINRDISVLAMIEEANGLVPKIARVKFAGGDYLSLEAKEAEILAGIEASLKKYGITMHDLDFVPICEQCGDTGKLRGGADCDCFKKYMFEYIAKRLSDGNGEIGFENAKKILDKEQYLVRFYQYAEEFCKRYPDVSKRVIFIRGNTGSGKTYLAKVMLEELVAKGASGLFLSAFTLEDAFLKHFYNSTSYKPSQIINDEYDLISRVDVLVVDDLGAEIIHRKDMQAYFLNMLDSRSENQKLTIFTSNLQEDSIASRYGERFLSRLKGTKTAVLTINSNKDLRGKS